MVLVHKLAVRNGLLVPLENVQRLLGVPQIVVMQVVVRTTERDMHGRLRVELDAADVGASFYGGDGLL